MVTRLLMAFLTSACVAVAQPRIDIHAVPAAVLNQHYIIIQIEYRNATQDTLVTYVQNWRAVRVGSSGVVFGFPYIPRLLNRMFLLPDTADLKNYASRIEDNYLGEIMPHSLKLLPPGARFWFAVTVPDSSIQARRGSRTQMVFMGNFASYNKLKPVFKKFPIAKFLHRPDLFVVPNLPVDRDTVWNTMLVRYSDASSTTELSKDIMQDILNRLQTEFTVITKRIVF